MAKSVQDIINEIRIRADVENITDEELLDYIDEQDDYLRETLFPEYCSSPLTLTTAESYDISSICDSGRIKRVLAKGKPLLRKRDPNDVIEGYIARGNSLSLSSSIVDNNESVVLVYAPKHVPHKISDTNLCAPEPFHDLYVFYALSQVAAKEADAVSYGNYKSDYNALLAEVTAAVTGNQVSPMVKWSGKS